LVRFCGATYELTLTPSFRIGDYPTFSAVFLDISLSAAAILVTPGSALATLCRRVIRIGSLNESHVLAAASYQTGAFAGRSNSGGLRPLHQWRSAPRAAAGNAEPGSRLSRGRRNGYSFSTETSVALIIAKTVSPSLRFNSFH
jgi:hypothetical protein